MQTVVLIDYGSGNLRSAEKALQAAARTLDEPTAIKTTADPDLVRRADRIVLPGVGAFAACREALYGREGLTEAMSEAVQGRGAPFLGVCVGMQLLATRGLEFGTHPGLDWIAGEVRRRRIRYFATSLLRRPRCISPTHTPSTRTMRRLWRRPLSMVNTSPPPWPGIISPGSSSTPKSLKAPGWR
jgi:hypothetical protein